MNNEEKRLKAALEFPIKGNLIHNNFYKDGYGEVEYINNFTKVKIKCPDHGFFYQAPVVHINQKGGCPKCAQVFFDNGRLNHYEDRKNKARLEFEKKANIVHNNKYKDGYNNDYKDSRTLIKIKCPEHDFFFQRPKDHLNGSGCPKCGNKISADKILEYSRIANERKRLKASLEFTDKANKVHNGFYKDGYIGKYINARTKLKIKCPIEGHGVFLQTPNNHLRGQGCPICNYSHGERNIWRFLKESMIEFITQHEYDDCKGDYKELPFDFYIPSINLLIEHDGEQHYKYKPGMHKSIKDFKQTQRYDKIKTEYALNKGIELLRIRYDEDLGVALSKLGDRIKELKGNTI
jgi:very-short-patch-repair endonuclease